MGEQLRGRPRVRADAWATIATVACRIIHLIPGLSFGGPTRCLIGLARASADSGAFLHEVIGLRSSSSGVRRMLEEAGLPVMEDPQPAHLMDAIEGADLVLLHFWNTPEVDSLLRAAWPKCRLAIWCHVAGDTPPQLVTPELIAFSDLTLASSPYSCLLYTSDAADE